ncbi:Ada metal-binding domain-containing protein [Sphingomonadaceae bacterium jetA1]|uniref:bifunctional transcriptional activator/DNA repair enzyme AdaA n=1 Tax=Facivitalis istanbulensis TaxID=3075838 RepID=UPI00346FA5BF
MIASPPATTPWPVSDKDEADRSQADRSQADRDEWEARAWDAFCRRDRAADGRFVVAVDTTGIYCRPSCPARRPRRENIRFLPDPAAARGAGYRPCLRCLPDQVARDRQAVATAIARIDAEEAIPDLATLASGVGYAPHHFHRLFKRAAGVTPAAYARARRAARTADALASETSVTRALYEAGYAGPSRFYAESDQRLGMLPGQWRRSGAGAAIHWTMAETPLGPLLIATTPRGVARLAFDEDATMLAARFPAATIREAEPQAREHLVDQLSRIGPADASLPDAARRTAFIEALSRALRADRGTLRT